MSGLTREEHTANPVFKGENLRPERGRDKQTNKHIFSFQLTTSGGIENYAGLMRNLPDMVSHYIRVIVVVVGKFTVSLLFVVWIREFPSRPDGFIMVSVTESNRT